MLSNADVGRPVDRKEGIVVLSRQPEARETDEPLEERPYLQYFLRNSRPRERWRTIGPLGSPSSEALASGARRLGAQAESGIDTFVEPPRGDPEGSMINVKEANRLREILEGTRMSLLNILSRRGASESC